MTDCPTPEAVMGLLQQHFPLADQLEILHLETGKLSLRVACGSYARRPGGFIAGPMMMMVADTCGLIGVFSHTGLTVPAFTTSLSIDFLRPGIGDYLLADARVAKFGRTLSTINVEMRGSDQEKPCAQAVVNFATGSAR
ncbi:MAG: PaaI family thioesterase [Pseudomonadota bacterium]